MNKYYWLIAALMLGCSKNETDPPAGTDAVSDSLALAVLAEVNAFRADSLQLPALSNNSVIEQQARNHSSYMVSAGVLSHDGFTTRVNTVAKEMSVSAAAENVAFGQSSAAEVVRSWLDSPGHRANISGSYSLTGIGIAKDSKGAYYFTQIFIRP